MSLIKCCFCSTSFANPSDRLGRLRIDPNFTDKFSFLCNCCKNNNISAQFTSFNELIDRLTHGVDKLMNRMDSNCEKLFNIESKVGLLSSHVEDISSSIEVVEQRIIDNAKTIAFNNSNYEKNISTVITFIDNFESFLNNTLDNKLKPVTTELGINSHQLHITNNKISVCNENLNSLEKTFSKKIISISETVSALSKNNNDADCGKVCTSISERDCSVLLNEMKLTRHMCSDLNDTVSMIQEACDLRQSTSSDQVDITTHPSLHQEILANSDTSHNTSHISHNSLDSAHNICLVSQSISATQFDNLTTGNNLISAPPPVISPVVNSNNNSFSIKVVPTTRCIFVSRFEISTKHSDVLSHIKSIITLNNINVDFDLIKCINISRFNGIVASFKITVPESLFDLLISPNSWPTSTFIKEFHKLSNVTLKNDSNSQVPNISAPKNLSACPFTTRT